ncbi:hypothetical protein HYV88_04600 [Candidatus Woesearchaeota archaeon]|nr:hypothetical protein [Candidatus Woesearchaeota archaeon]
MKKGMSSMEVIVYILIILVVVFAVIFFISGNSKTLSESFFKLLEGFK